MFKFPPTPSRLLRGVARCPAGLEGRLRFLVSGSKAKPGVTPSYTREQIVEVASALVDEAGSAGFSMRALAQRVGISPMGLYTYFPSKDRILFQVFSDLADQVDNAPVPGEYWEDTLHRTCASLRSTFLAHPRTRLMYYELGLRWPQHHNRNIYQMHADQGIPVEIYESLYAALRAYLTGFIDNEAREMVRQMEPTDDPYDRDDWKRIYDESLSDASFHEGIDLIIGGIRAKAAPDPCDWRTPEDRSLWTWEG